MIKARAQTKDGPLLVFGLSAANITKLQEGLPILFSLDIFGMDGRVTIFAGDTEASMLEELKASGVAIDQIVMPKD